MDTLVQGHDRLTDRLMTDKQADEMGQIDDGRVVDVFGKRERFSLSNYEPASESTLKI